MTMQEWYADQCRELVKDRDSYLSVKEHFLENVEAMSRLEWKLYLGGLVENVTAHYRVFTERKLLISQLGYQLGDEYVQIYKEIMDA